MPVCGACRERWIHSSRKTTSLAGTTDGPGPVGRRHPGCRDRSLPGAAYSRNNARDVVKQPTTVLGGAPRLHRRRLGGAAGDLPEGLSELRHDLLPALGTGDLRRPEPGLWRPAGPHPAPALRPARCVSRTVRRRRDHDRRHHRLHQPRPARLARLQARPGLVRPCHRGRRRLPGDDQRPGAEQRPARLHRHPLHGALSGGTADRDEEAEGRLAGARPAQPRGTAPPRGVALRRLLLPLSGPGPETTGGQAHPRAEAPRGRHRPQPRPDGLPGRLRPGDLAPVRPDHDRQRLLFVHRHP